MNYVPCTGSRVRGTLHVGIAQAPAAYAATRVWQVPLISLPALIVFSVLAQLLAVPVLFWVSHRYEAV